MMVSDSHPREIEPAPRPLVKVIMTRMVANADNQLEEIKKPPPLGDEGIFSGRSSGEDIYYVISPATRSAALDSVITATRLRSAA